MPDFGADRMFNINPLAFAQLKKKGVEPNLPPLPAQVLASPVSEMPAVAPPMPAVSAPMVSSPPEMAPVMAGAPPIPANLPPPMPIPAPNRTEQAVLNTPPPPKTEKRKGFWGRLGDIGESFLLSGGNPLVAAMVGFKPEMLGRFKDRAINEPRWLQERKIALGEAGALDEADDDTAKRTGIDPRTGMPTLDAGIKQQQIEFKHNQLEQAYARLEQQERLGLITRDIQQQKADIAQQLADLKAEMQPILMDLNSRRGQAVTENATTNKENAQTRKQQVNNSFVLGKERNAIGRMSLAERARHNGVTEAQQRANEAGRNTRQDKAIANKKSSKKWYEDDDGSAATPATSSDEIEYQGKRYKKLGINPKTGKMRLQLID